MNKVKLRASPWQTAFANIDFKNVIVTLQDLAAANSLQVKIGEGNLTYSEKVNREYVKDRGTLDTVRDGDEEPVEVNFDFTWEYVRGPSSASTTSDGTPTIEDALKNVGAAASWTSTDADGCAPYAIDIVITNTPVPSACGDSEVITLADFRYESINHDIKAGTCSITGKCNVTDATVLRAAQ